MAFKLDLSPKYRWPVNLTLIGEDGAPQEHGFHVDFARVKQSDVEEIVKSTQSGKMSDQQFLERLVVGWDGVQSVSGDDLGFSADNLILLCDIVGVRGAIVRAWFDSIREGPAKN